MRCSAVLADTVRGCTGSLYVRQGRRPLFDDLQLLDEEIYRSLVSLKQYEVRPWPRAENSPAHDGAPRLSRSSPL